MPRPRLVALLVVPTALAACGPQPDQPVDPVEEALPVEEQGAGVADEEPDVGAAEQQRRVVRDDEPARPLATPEELPVDGGDDDAEAAVLVDVRVADHDDFDRVVYEFDAPVGAWEVQRSEGPVVEEVTGAELDVDGEDRLVVVFDRASASDLDGAAGGDVYDGPDRITVDGDAVTETVLTRDHDERLAWVVGLGSDHPIAVETLEGPWRLVVDVVPPS